jgi:hypothetical protein
MVTEHEYAGRDAVVGELAQIVAQALNLQDEADAAIRACGVAGTVPDDAAVRLGELLRVYGRLHYAAEDVQAGGEPELIRARRELLELLSYHLHMLRDAGDLVFSGRDVPRNRRFRLELAQGLGPRAAELTRLRDELISIA